MQRTHYSRRDFLRHGAWGGVGLLLGSRGALAATARKRDRLPSGLELIPRRDWTGIAARTDRMRRAEGFERVTVHHSGKVAEAGVRNAVIYELECILAGHMDRRYGDIGYHMIVDRAGRLWEGRSLAYRGAHVLSANAGNIGIVLLGNFERQDPSEKQIATLHRALYHLCQRYRLQADEVYGHRDLGASVCPGRYLYTHLQRMRRATA